MATNGKSGDGRRHGAVKNRSQFKNSRTNLWVKRNGTTGRFMDVKTSSQKPYKGITKEN